MKHVVKQGEDMYSLAQRYGLGSFRTIYDHPQNAELASKRPDPHVLSPGDEVFIPDEDDAPAVSVAADARHVFKAKAHRLKVHLVDARGKPLSGADCSVEVSDGTMLTKTTDDAGMLELAFLHRPTWVKIAGADCVWRLRVGGLDPLRDTEDDGAGGVQQRLHNLGCAPGKLDRRLGPYTREAVRVLQRRRGMEPTGRVDDAFLAELDAAHGR